uniref:Uncharacterized protein n=1 Tax=Nonomuraea gerenzanensis TaxID=93944 RepID=A0A1M4EN70_9ACTN|nr:hypothetical protein BN4615_P9803 [Nonomuraea gerenzanensis]
MTSATAAITAMKASAAPSLSTGVTLCAGTSSMSQSRPTATAIEPRISARYGLRPYMNAASGTANTSVATLIGCTATSGAKLSATACRQAPENEMMPPTHHRGRRTRLSEAPSATTSNCCIAAPSAYPSAPARAISMPTQVIAARAGAGILSGALLQLKRPQKHQNHPLG